MRSAADTISRLTDVLRAETAGLKAGGTPDLATIADAKARLLLELTMPRNGADAERPSAAALKELAVVLSENARTLERHIAAVNRVATMLTGAMRDADNDGTYGMQHRSGAR
ncbi:MAG: hypothetical protein HC779_00035 [Phyllobacteriaceae bacterium]|nr:hypothetical protein [Phyllobacteriaceae bacterium]